MTAMTCERFAAILPDYFEGDLSDDAKGAADAHAKNCASCSRIVADINRITGEAAALPAMRPSRDLWSGIEQRISAPVIPLAQPARRSVQPFAARWMAAAAAALVITTAGVTYVATSRSAVTQPARVAVLSPKVVTPVVDSNVTTPAVASATDKTPATTKTPDRAATRTTPAGNTPTGSLASAQADATYAREIEILEKMVASPKSGLDSATIQVIKKDLQVIDDAIAQSKAALVKDPASTLLYDQVTRAMSKKVELLRTMASLSSST